MSLESDFGLDLDSFEDEPAPTSVQDKQALWMALAAVGVTAYVVYTIGKVQTVLPQSEWRHTPKWRHA
jgi:hypothetical protein